MLRTGVSTGTSNSPCFQRGGGGAPALWTPLQLGAALTDFFLFDDENITIEGSGISNVTNLAGGNDLTQTNDADRPTQVTLASGAKAANFNGTQFLNHTGLCGGRTSHKTVLVITDGLNVTTDRQTIIDGDSSGDFFMQAVGTAPALRYYQAGNWQRALPSAENYSNLKLVTFGTRTGDGGIQNATIYENDVLSTNNNRSNIGGFLIDNGRIANGYSGLNNLTGRVCALAVVEENAQTITDFDKFCGWYSWTFAGDGSKLQSGHPYKDAPPTL